MPTAITSATNTWTGRLLRAAMLLLAVAAAWLWTAAPVAAQTVAPGSAIGSCMEVKFGTKLGCTAGDVTWGNFYALPLDGCSGPDDTYSAVVTTTLSSTANERYDIGIWLNLYGDSAITDMRSTACYHTYLTPLSASAAVTDSGVGPFLDVDGDLCGDIYAPDGWNTVLLNQALPIQASCFDVNGNGVVDLPAGSACWSDANNAGDVCNDLSQAIPGTTSKCACNETPIDMPITTIPWRLEIVCTPSKTTVTSLPATVSCEVVYFNGSNTVTATNYSIQNFYPISGTVSNISDGGVDNGGSIAWILPTVGPGITGTYSFSYTLESGLADGSVLTHTAQLYYDDVPQVIKAADTLHIGDTFADLQTTLTSSNPEPAPGSTVIYTVTVVNYGPAPADNVTVTFDLPDGMSLVGASPSPLGTDPLIWYPGTVGAGITQTYVITALVAPTATTTLEPVVNADSTTPDNEPANNVDTALTDPLWPNLVVEISDGVTWVRKGDELVYEIVVRNDGNTTAADSALTMTLPASVTLGSASDGGTPSGDLILWSLGNLEPGQIVTRYVTVTVDSTLPPTLGGLLAPVTAESPTGDSDPTDNTAQDLDYIEGNTLADLTVTIADSPDPVEPGSVLVYTVTVTNNGPNAAEGVSLTFDLPGGLLLTGVVPTQTSGTDPLIWDIGALPNGGTRIYVITATVPLTATGPLTPTAVVGGTTLDPDLTNNTATAETSLGSPDLVTTVDDGVTNVTGGEVLVYEIVVRNDGGASAASTGLTFTLPASVTLGSASDGGASSGGAVVWPLGEMSPGEVVTRYVTVTVASTLPPSLTKLTATATAQSPSGDATPENNTDSDVDTVGDPAADLEVSLTDSPDPVTPGAPIVYTIIVTNNGTLPAENVTLTLDLPPGMTPVGITPTQSSGADPLVWNLGTVPSGTVQTFVVTVTAPLTTTGPLTPTAVVTSTTPDPDPTNNTDSENTSLTGPDLVTTVDDGVTNVTAGDVLVYQIVVRNDGTDPAASTGLTFTLPASVTLGSASDGGTPSGGAVVWPLGEMSPGEVVTRYVTVTVSPNLPPAVTSLTGTATATSPSGDGNPSNNTDTDVDTIGTPTADLRVTLTDSPDPVVPGSPIVYTLMVTNFGTSPAENVTLTLDLPPGVTLVGATPTQSSGTDPLVWHLGTVPSGTVQTIVVTVTAPLTMTSPLTPTAVVTSTTPDPTPFNNTDTATTSRAMPDLVTTVDDKVATFSAGDVLVYEIVVRNDGIGSAANASLTFTLPANTSFGSASDSGASSGGAVVWPLGEMSPGEVVTRYVTVTVSPSLPTTVTSLTAAATAQSPSGDATPSNNTDTDVDAVSGATVSDLKVTMTDSPDPVTAGSPIVYVVTVTNLGPDPADNVTVTLDLPPGVTLVGATPTQSGGTDPLVWNPGTLPSGATRTYVVTVTVSPDTLSDLTATATVASTSVDTNPDNNTDPETTTVVAPDLVMSVRPSTDAIEPGETITYFVTLTNTGEAPIAGSVVTAEVPPGTVFNPGASTPGWTCTPNGAAGGVCTYPVGGLDPDEVDDLTFALDVLDTLPPGTTNLDMQFRAGGDNGQPVNAAVDNQAVVVLYPALEMQLTSTPPAGTSVAPGDPITYRVTITSVGTLTATGVVITAPIPAGTYLVPGSASPTPGGTGPLVWNLGDMPPGAVAEVTYVVTTDPVTGQTSVVAYVQAAGGDMVPIDSNVVMHPLGATAIELERLEVVVRAAGGIDVRWQVAAMQDSLGFNILRASSRDASAARRINRSLIPAVGIGAYRWTDVDGSASSYYWLEEIDLNGTAVRYGPVGLSAPVFAGPVHVSAHSLEAIASIAAVIAPRAAAVPMQQSVAPAAAGVRAAAAEVQTLVVEADRVVVPAAADAAVAEAAPAVVNAPAEAARVETSAVVESAAVSANAPAEQPKTAASQQIAQAPKVNVESPPAAAPQAAHHEAADAPAAKLRPYLPLVLIVVAFAALFGSAVVVSVLFVLRARSR